MAENLQILYDLVISVAENLVDSGNKLQPRIKVCLG